MSGGAASSGAASSSDASLRLFVAIELPDEVRRALEQTTAALRRALPEGSLRWVRPDGIHVTLKFLGATPAARVDAVRDALASAVGGAAAFDLRPGGIGSFGGRRNLRVVWVGVEGDTAALAALAERIEAAMEPLGFAREQRAFNAHLTLARVRDEATPSEREQISDALASFPSAAMLSFRAADVSLMRSTLGRGGAKYDALAHFPLNTGGTT